MSAYYNEHDRNAAAWLRELIKAGLIAPGDVDERSIEDVTPNDIAGYTQCHFFAGITQGKAPTLQACSSFDQEGDGRSGREPRSSLARRAWRLCGALQAFRVQVCARSLLLDLHRRLHIFLGRQGSDGRSGGSDYRVAASLVCASGRRLPSAVFAGGMSGRTSRYLLACIDRSKAICCAVPLGWGTTSRTSGIHAHPLSTGKGEPSASETCTYWSSIFGGYAMWTS